MGQILLKERELDKARAQFSRAVAVREDFLPAHVILARMALDAEDFSGAEVHLRRILQADAKNAEAHLDLGVAYKGMGDYDKALREYEEAEKLNPELPAIYLDRGIILHRHKDAPDRALEMYRKYLALQAGGAALTADAPVFNLVKEAEQMIQVREEAARAEEEAKKMEAAQKAQEAALKESDAKAHPPEPQPAAESKAPAKQAKPAKTGAVKQAPEPAPAPKSVAAPAPKKDRSDEPSDAL
jgi:Flp pilus assembly protein TadD